MQYPDHNNKTLQAKQAKEDNSKFKNETRKWRKLEIHEQNNTEGDIAYQVESIAELEILREIGVKNVRRICWNIVFRLSTNSYY